MEIRLTFTLDTNFTPILQVMQKNQDTEKYSQQDTASQLWISIHILNRAMLSRR